MALSVPTLDVFFIDFNLVKEKTKGEKFASGLRRFTAVMGGPIYLLAYINSSTYKEDCKALRRLIDEKRFNIITSKEELDTYINPQNNEWIINDKSLKKRQYYIRHPKKAQQNILIEAKDFYNYI